MLVHFSEPCRANGYGGEIKPPGIGPQVLVHVSIYLGKPFWQELDRRFYSMFPLGSILGTYFDQPNCAKAVAFLALRLRPRLTLRPLCNWRMGEAAKRVRAGAQRGMREGPYKPSPVVFIGNPQVRSPISLSTSKFVIFVSPNFGHASSLLAGKGNPCVC